VTNVEYEAKIRTYQWLGLQTLHQQILARDTPGWAPGKAWEYLVIRAFELDNASVRWPYEIQVAGEVVEQIDGAVVAGGLHCLIESKDESKPLTIAPPCQDAEPTPASATGYGGSDLLDLRLY